MTTCWPKISERRAPRMRANTSDPLPAGNVTTIVSGRVGQSCAAAGMMAAASAAPRTTLLMFDMATLRSNARIRQTRTTWRTPNYACLSNHVSLVDCALRRAHVAQRKSRDSFVLLGERAQLVLGDELVEIVERAVAHQLLDPDVDEIGRMLAVGAHHLGGRLAPLGLERGERGARIAVRGERIGEGARVDRALRRPVRP